jgi:trehalose/maltose hydrolase-like predicted phosphorylase
LRTAGAEILFETARFWASRATLEADGKRHIRGVIGPDEYHESIDDNAFTNVMARWNILRALDTVTFLRKSFAGDWSEISGRLSIDDAELALRTRSEVRVGRTICGVLPTRRHRPSAVRETVRPDGCRPRT